MYIYIVANAISSSRANDISFPRAVESLKRASLRVAEIHGAIRAAKLLPSDSSEHHITGDKLEKSRDSGNRGTRRVSVAAKRNSPPAFAELAPFG